MTRRSVLWALLGLTLLGAVVVLWQTVPSNKTVVSPPGPVSVSVYFGVPGTELLVEEKREVQSGKADVGTVIELLIAGPRMPGHVAVIPNGTKLLSWNVKDGTATVNFNKTLVTAHPGGSSAELQTVFAIVNSLTRLPGIERVRFEIEGAAVDTLAGHVDLTGPLEFSEEMVASGSDGPEKEQ